VTAPFDRTLPSPIAGIMQMRSAGAGSVVVAGSSRPVLHVDTGLEDRLLDAIAAPGSEVRLVVLSGSAGGGKSSAIDRLLGLRRDLFEQCIEDATHAETPGEDQVERLETFFAPFRDGAATPPARPRLIAMNTGLMIRFFRDMARRAGGKDHDLSELERVLRQRMGLPSAGNAVRSPLDHAVLVVNLDHRPTTGGTDSFFARQLAAVSPRTAASPFALTGRCGTCAVRDWCAPRTNADMIADPTVRGVLDQLADRLAQEKGRPLAPRALRDLAATMILGGTSFDAEEDPCDAVLRWRESGNASAVFDNILPNGVFTGPDAGGLASQLAQTDPSFAPSGPAHDIISGTGIDTDSDARRLIEWLGGEDRPALTVAVRAMAPAADSMDARFAVARCLVRAAYLASRIELPDEPDRLFVDALGEYGAETGVTEAIGRLEDLVSSALARSFGHEVGMQRFFRIHASRAGTVDVLVAADLSGSGPAALSVVPDRAKQHNPQGTRITGYRPMAITLSLAGVELQVDRPLFRVLARAAAGARPSADELERFFALRRAVEAIGREASLDFDQPLLLADTATGIKHRLTRRRDYRGQPQITVQEVH